MAASSCLHILTSDASIISPVVCQLLACFCVIFDNRMCCCILSNLDETTQGLLLSENYGDAKISKPSMDVISMATSDDMPLFSFHNYYTYGKKMVQYNCASAIIFENCTFVQCIPSCMIASQGNRRTRM